MKKLIALGLSTMMMFSGIVANAELETSTDDQIIVTLPTQAEIEARTPNIALEVVSQYETDADVKKDTARTFYNSYSVENYDIYKLKATISNLGDLAAAWNDGVNDYAYCSVYNIQIMLKTNAIVAGNSKTAVNGKTYAASQHSSLTDYFCLSWASGGASNSYPKLNEDPDTLASIANADAVMESTYAIAVAKESVVEISDMYAIITYQAGPESVKAIDNTNATMPASLTIGTVTPDPEPEAKLAISAKKETAVGTPTMDGHVWSVKLTKGSADITELNAVFTADGYEPAEKTIKSGLDTLNKLTPDGEGFLNFYIGLKTSKPEVGASFTVKNGVDPEATWPAAN